MKTDMDLQVTFRLGRLTVPHKTLMVSAKEFFILVNHYRSEAGLPATSFKAWRNTQAAREYVDFLEAQGVEAVKISRGRADSKMHLKVAIRAAIDLAPAFADEVIEMFMEKKLPLWRDAAGDAYKERSEAIAAAAVPVLGKPAHQGHFRTLADIVRKRCGVENWNSATAEQLQERFRIENSLAQLLRLNVVRDWDHLKELAKTV